MPRCRMGRDCPAGNPETIDGHQICEDCARANAAEISDLLNDYFDLSNNLIGSTVPSDGMPPPPNPAESSPPLDLTVDELMRAIVWAACIWEIPVREVLQLADAPQTRIRPGWLTHRATALLAENIHVLAALPTMWSYVDGVDGEPVMRDGIAAIRSLRSLHRRARQHLGVTGYTVRLPGTCPADSCGAADLRRTAGREEVYCGHCARTWAWAEYRRYVSLTVSGNLLPQLAPTARNQPATSPVRGV